MNEGRRVQFIEEPFLGSCCAAQLHAEQVTCGSLIRHVAPSANPSRFACLYNFLTQFLRQLLRAFWFSKWVMHGTVGNLEKSTFQRYKVCANRSLDRKVMAPGSRGVGAVFLAKIPAKREMLLANRELRHVAVVAVFLKVPNLWTNS